MKIITKVLWFIVGLMMFLAIATVMLAGCVAESAGLATTMVFIAVGVLTGWLARVLAGIIFAIESEEDDNV